MVVQMDAAHSQPLHLFPVRHLVSVARLLPAADLAVSHGSVPAVNLRAQPTCSITPLTQTLVTRPHLFHTSPPDRVNRLACARQSSHQRVRTF